MRLLLAIFALVGLLASPVAASAAQAMCRDHSGAQTMAMSGMPGMVTAEGQKADPCCNPGKVEGQKKHSEADCAQACAAMCGVMAALPSTPAVFLTLPDHDAPPAARLASLKPHEPSRLERPPKSIV